MERLVIEKLEGAHRNSVEGVTNAPEVVKNLDFDRAGGYTPLGGIDTSWLGGPAYILLETEDYVLLEDDGKLERQGSSNESFGDATSLIAYDEAGMALLAGPQLWYANELSDFNGGLFGNERNLALAPRAGIVTPWRQDASGYIGASRFIGIDGQLSYGDGAGTVTVTENAGTGTAAGDYEFIWLLEAPTDNGLVVFAVGTHEHTVSAEIESCSIELDTVHPEGTTARFYYRTTAEDAFERFSTLVSDGVNEMEATLTVEGEFVPTDDALISFAGGRLEAHNGRMWGLAADKPITTFQPTDQLLRQAGGYMLLSGGDHDTLRQYGSIDSGDMPMRVAGDYVEMNIQNLSVTWPGPGNDLVVELFSIRKTATPTIDMHAVLRWSWATSLFFGWSYMQPELQLYTGQTGGGTLRVNTFVGINALRISAGSPTLNVSSLTVRFDITSVSPTIDVDWEVTLGASSSSGSFSSATGSNWSNWVSAAATRLAVGGADYKLSSYVLGDRELRVTSLEAGNGATVTALGHIDDYEPDSLTWTSSSTNGETWTTQSHDTMFLNYGLGSIDLPDENPAINPLLTLTYSSVGSVNRGKTTNFLTFNPLASTTITALASTPAGLLVFMENETFLVRGDPLTELSSQRLSGTIGCDPNVIPARMGAVVMPIYKGEVYAVNLGGGDVDFGGSMVNISRPIWLPNDPFMQVVGEAKRQHIVARTAEGRVYRMDVSEQKWLNDPFDEIGGLVYLLPNDTDAVYGTRYNLSGYLAVVSDDTIDTPSVQWVALDAGDKNAMKLWRRMEVFTQGVGDGTPTLTYTARGVSDTVSGINKGEGRWVFTFKRGVVSPTVGLELEFLGATEDFVMEPPVVIEYVPRYRQR